MKKVRVDKWLWAVRIFKSRSLATKACKEGAVKMDDDKLKPAHLIEPDNILAVRKNGFDLRIKVIKLLSKRVGAPIAQTCYQDLTPEDEYNKYEAWYNRKKKSEFREKGLGRPTKKDRREIDKLKKGL